MKQIHELVDDKIWDNIRIQVFRNLLSANIPRKEIYDKMTVLENKWIYPLKHIRNRL